MGRKNKTAIEFMRKDLSFIGRCILEEFRNKQTHKPEIYIRDGLIASRTGRNKGDFTQKLFRL